MKACASLLPHIIRNLVLISQKLFDIGSYLQGHKGIELFIGKGMRNPG